ncbi:MAG: hypothetical protein OXG35_09565 [Acidobacteria bacterium]|nr:hypothetical protein [Acidobacteriota bacterium]
MTFAKLRPATPEYRELFPSPAAWWTSPHSPSRPPPGRTRSSAEQTA